MDIGKKIKALRKDKKLTLKHLSETSGIAIATLSRIETGRMTGTVRSHQAIASVLGISLPQLYGDIQLKHKAVDFQSTRSRTDIFVHNDRAAHGMLTNNVLSKKMMPVMLKISAGGSTTQEELPKPTEKFIYVLKGECAAYIEDKSYILKAGETLYFDAALAHSFKNTGDTEVKAICVITPPAL